MTLPSRPATHAAVRRSSVLVVGGAGYIGSILSAELLRAGYNVVVLDSLLYGGQSLSTLLGRPGFELHVGDSRDETIVRRLLGDVGHVVHLGEIVGDPACNLDPDVTLDVNFTATARLAHLAREMGVERFVYTSSCSVYGANDEVVDETCELNPISHYARLKIAAEDEILGLAGNDFHPTVYRLATVYGRSPRPRFDLVVNTLTGRAVAEGQIVVHGGGQWRPFVHVADVASMLLETMTIPLELVSGEVFNLGSNDQNHTIRGIAEIVRATVSGTVLEVAEVEDHRNYRVAFDKVADVLGFRAARTIHDGVREIAEAMRSGQIVDHNDPAHSNVRALVETDARTKLWRDGFVGQPAAAFRPRDVEADRFRLVPAAGREPAPPVAR